MFSSVNKTLHARNGTSNCKSDYASDRQKTLPLLTVKFTIVVLSLVNYLAPLKSRHNNTYKARRTLELPA